MLLAALGAPRRPRSAGALIGSRAVTSRLAIPSVARRLRCSPLVAAACTGGGAPRPAVDVERVLGHGHRPRPGRPTGSAAARAAGLRQHPARRSSSCRRTGRSITTSARSRAPTASRRRERATSTVCVPDPRRRPLRRPYHDSTLSSRAAARRQPHSDTDVDGGKMDGFIRAVGRRARTYAPTRVARDCAGTYLGPQDQPDVMGYHDARGDPELLGVRRAYMLQDQHVRADRLVDPARAPVPGLGVGRALPGPARPDELPVRPRAGRAVGHAARAARTRIYAWTDITYLLHEHDVSWAYYVGDGTCCFDPSERRRRGASTPSAQNPLPVVHDGARETASWTTSRRTRDFYTAAADGTLPSVSWIMPGQRRVSEHPQQRGAVWRRAGVRDERDQRGHAAAPTGTRRRSSSRGTTGAASTTTSCRRGSTRTATGSACRAC